MTIYCNRQIKTDLVTESFATISSYRNIVAILPYRIVFVLPYLFKHISFHAVNKFNNHFHDDLSCKKSQKTIMQKIHRDITKKKIKTCMQNEKKKAEVSISKTFSKKEFCQRK